MRHISLDLIRVTEAAAIAASQWIGSGNKEQADRAATEAMRKRFANMDFHANVIMGEGLKDKSYGIMPGEKIGNIDRQVPDDKIYDLAVDPIEGTTPTVTSGPEAISCLALAHKNSLFASDRFYMQKIAYGPQVKAHAQLSIEDPIEDTVQIVAKSTGKSISKVMVCIMNRPRHHETIDKLRKMGVRIKLIQDCDVSGAVATCLPNSGVDLFYGIGGAPEAILTACAIKCLGGDFQAKEVAADPEKASWSVYGPILRLQDLVRGECVFVATGITDGSILDGVVQGPVGPITHSVFMRSESGTVRWMTAEHGN